MLSALNISQSVPLFSRRKNLLQIAIKILTLLNMFARMFNKRKPLVGLMVGIDMDSTQAQPPVKLECDMQQSRKILGSSLSIGPFDGERGILILLVRTWIWVRKHVESISTQS